MVDERCTVSVCPFGTFAASARLQDRLSRAYRIRFGGTIEVYRLNIGNLHLEKDEQNGATTTAKHAESIGSPRPQTRKQDLSTGFKGHLGLRLSRFDHHIISVSVQQMLLRNTHYTSNS